MRKKNILYAIGNTGGKLILSFMKLGMSAMI